MDLKQTFGNILSTVINWAASAGIKLLIALAILFVSFKIINFIGRKIERSYKKGRIDKTLATTFAYIFKLGLKCIVAICLVGYVGIDTSGLAAVVTSFGVCAGLALNGALANLAGGVLIILTRPFKVDDYVEAEGFAGTVEDIHITYTRLRTPDNKIVYVPNGKLSSDIIINYSEKETRRVDLTFSISHSQDFEAAKRVINEFVSNYELALSDPTPLIRVSAHTESKTDIAVKAWVKSGDYWTAYFDLLEGIKLAFDKNGIEIPHNQLDVTIKDAMLIR